MIPATSDGVNPIVASPTPSSTRRIPGVSVGAVPQNVQIRSVFASRRISSLAALRVVHSWVCIIGVWGGLGTTSMRALRRQRASASWSASSSREPVIRETIGMYSGEHASRQFVPSSARTRIRSSRTAQAASRWGSR